jgi:hypothetical protein
MTLALVFFFFFILIYTFGCPLLRTRLTLGIWIFTFSGWSWVNFNGASGYLPSNFLEPETEKMFDVSLEPGVPPLPASTPVGPSLAGGRSRPKPPAPPSKLTQQQQKIVDHALVSMGVRKDQLSKLIEVNQLERPWVWIASARLCLLFARRLIRNLASFPVAGSGTHLRQRE